MPNRNLRPKPVTLSAYLSWEAANPAKHEFVRGEVYAMSGVTRRHDKIVLNMLLRLAAAARGARCTVNSADVKVQPAADVVYYPDLSVDCVQHQDSDLIVDRPCLIVEVTSASTARADRGEKADNYRRSPSLRAYLVVDHRRRRVTCHRRDDGGAWHVEDVADGGAVELPCLHTHITLDEIYEGVELPPIGVGEPDFAELEEPVEYEEIVDLEEIAEFEGAAELDDA